MYPYRLFRRHTVKHGWNEGEGEGGGKFLIPSSPSPSPPPHVRLGSAKEVKNSHSFGLSVRRHYGKQ